jgi:DNA recombination protein Rad52
MAFTQTQVRKLAGKLPERFVKTRAERGLTLSYVEGWHVIDEANRVFGFDGWDRETVAAECVWQDARISPKACSYAVRVRIKVRAGKTIISREGTGLGHGTGATLGEAHESALKEAETDATKRALVTFGNLFGLALYDKEQNGVQRAQDQELSAAPVVWTLVQGNAPPRVCDTPQLFCSAAKESFRQATSVAELEALWTGNAPVIAQLRAIRPELRTRSGVHYTEVLENLYRQQRTLLEPESRETQASSETPPSQHTAVAIVIPRRLRNAAHLKSVAALPCLVCGRSPSHAHHLRFIQPRSLGSKPSDEWTVPLCPIHHRALHDAGREEQWWQINGIDAKAEAERLWASTRQQPDPLVPIAATVPPTLEPDSREPNSPEPEAQPTPSSESNNVEVPSLGRVLHDTPPASN